MKVPFFGKPEYQAPQVSSVPPGQKSENSGTYVNEERREIMVRIFDDGTPKALSLALGELAIASDVIKQTISDWHMKEARKKAILVPRGLNGKGDSHG